MDNTPFQEYSKTKDVSSFGKQNHPQEHPVSQEQEKPKEQVSPSADLPRIHTLRGDTERFVKEKGITLASIVAEKQRKIIDAPKIRQGRSKIMWIAAVLFMLGIAGAVFFFMRNGGPQTSMRPDTPAALYPFFDNRIILVRNSPADFIPEWQSLLLRSIPREQMLGVFVFSEVKNKFLTPSEWFDFLGIVLPSSLRSTFRDAWTLGVLGTSSGSAPVLLVPVSSFGQALAGMLSWEKDQPLALRNILPQNGFERKFEQFQDAIIKNQDARFLKNEAGQIILVYGFFNRRILILTTSFEAMEQVIERFLVVPPVL